MKQHVAILEDFCHGGIPPCVPIVDGGSLVTVWGGVRWEPASESLWDEPNIYNKSAKLAKMAQNG